MKYIYLVAWNKGVHKPRTACTSIWKGSNCHERESDNSKGKHGLSLDKSLLAASTPISLVKTCLPLVKRLFGYTKSLSRTSLTMACTTKWTIWLRRGTRATQKNEPIKRNFFGGSTYKGKGVWIWERNGGGGGLDGVTNQSRVGIEDSVVRVMFGSL